MLSLPTPFLHLAHEHRVLAVEEAVLAMSWSNAQEAKQQKLKGSEMFGFHPRSQRAEEKLLWGRTEGSREPLDPGPEIARKGDKYRICPWYSGMRGLEISNDGGHASILLIFHSVAEKNITCHLLAFPALNFGSIQQEKNPVGKSEQAET